MVPAFIARQGEVTVAGVGIAGGDDGGCSAAAVRLQGQGMDTILKAEEVGGEHTTAAEVGIQAAIGVVARQGEVASVVVREGVFAEAGGDDGGDSAAAVRLQNHGIGRIAGVVEEGGGHQAIIAEGEIQAAIGVVARQGEIGVSAAAMVGIPSGDKLAIRLQGQGIDPIRIVRIATTIVGEVGDHLATAAEAGIQAAIWVVAHQGEIAEVVIVASVGVPGGDELTVWLQEQGVGFIPVAEEIGGELAIAVEGGIQAAIGVVARQGEIPIYVLLSVTHTGDDQLAIRLHDQGIGLILFAEEVGGHLAIAVEGCVQAAIGVVARQGKIVVRVAYKPGSDELAVRLHDQGIGFLRTAAEVGGHPAIAIEGWVQAAIGVVARQGEVVAAAVDEGIPGHNELAVRLYDQGTGFIITIEEVGGHLAIAVEGGVERPGRAAGHEADQAGGGAGIEAGDGQQIAIRVVVVGQHVSQGEGGVFIGNEPRAKIIHRDGCEEVQDQR